MFLVVERDRAFIPLEQDSCVELNTMLYRAIVGQGINGNGGT